MTTNRTTALAAALAAYRNGDTLAIHRFCRDTLGYRGGDAMRATRRYKTALGL